MILRLIFKRSPDIPPVSMERSADLFLKPFTLTIMIKSWEAITYTTVLFFILCLSLNGTFYITSIQNQILLGRVQPYSDSNTFDMSLSVCDVCTHLCVYVYSVCMHVCAYGCAWMDVCFCGMCMHVFVCV